MTADEENFGTLERHDRLSVLRYRRHLGHPPDKVWRALTEPDHQAGWFPTTMEGDRAAGALLRFQFRENQGAPFDGEMLAFEPTTRMELRWADDILRFDLQPEGAGSVLHLIVTFPEYGKAARDAAGWHVCLEQLDHVVDGAEPAGSASDRWRHVHARYVERLGPEASTIGPPQEWEVLHGADEAGT